MKVLVIVLLSVAFTAATKTPPKVGITPQKLGTDKITQFLAEQIPWESLRDYVLENGEIQDGYIQANVTDFYFKVLTNVGHLLIEKGFDPFGLPDQKAGLFPVGSVKLTNGHLSDLSSLTTSDTVLVKYTYGTKILDIVLPISFDSISINYDYVTQITLLKISGDLEAKVTDFKINLRAGFNLTNYHAFVDDIDVKNSGTITLNIHGSGITDAIINILSNVLTSLFHGILITVIDSVIQNPIKSAADVVNKLIDDILNLNSGLSDLVPYY